MRDTSDLEIPESRPRRRPGRRPAGRHSVDVGLDHHGVERLVDPSAGFEDRREEAAFAQLGDAQLDVAGLGRHQTVPGAVAVSETRLSARS